MKWRGKSSPAAWRHAGPPNSIRSKSTQGMMTLPAESPGRTQEVVGNGHPSQMIALDRIRLIGTLRIPT